MNDRLGGDYLKGSRGGGVKSAPRPFSPRIKLAVPPRLLDSPFGFAFWMAKVEQRKSEKKGVLAALPAAERREKPPIETLFTDVYKEMPLHLKEQEQELLEHLKKYPEP